MSADVAQNQQETAPPELFVLRDEQGPILYAPLASLIARANESAVAAALAYAKDPGSIEGMTDDERAVVQGSVSVASSRTARTRATRWGSARHR